MTSNLSGNSISVKQHCSKAPGLIIERLLFNKIGLSFWQPEKHFIPISVTDAGSITFSKRLLIEYLQLIIPQYFISNKSGIWSLSLIVHSKG